MKQMKISPNYTIHNADDLEEKWSAMGLDDHLKMGRIAGMIGPFRRGASAYMEEPSRTNNNYVSGPRFCLHIRTEVEDKILDVPTAQKKLEIICNRSVFVERKASHVVERVLYGLDIYCVFQQQRLPPADGHQELSKEEMNQSVEQFRDWLQDGEQQAVDPCQEISVTLFCDWGGQSQPRTLTYAEAYDACFQWLDEAANNPPTSYAIPLTAWLRPLTEIPSTRARGINYHSISQQTMAECFDVFRKTGEIEFDLRQISSTIQQDRKRSEMLKRFESALSQFGRLYRAKLAEQVKSIRAGTSGVNVGERALKEAVTIVHQSIFSPGRLANWLERMKFQIDVLQRLREILPDVPIHEDVANFEIVTRSSKEPVLALKLPNHLAIEIHEPLLRELDNYLKDHPKLTSSPAGQHVELLQMPQWRSELVSIANQFAKFINENKLNKLASYQMLVDDSQNSVPFFHLYKQDGIARRFQLPSPPTGLHVSKNKRGKITLDWNTDDQQHVTGFLVEYRCIDDGVANRLTTNTGRIQLDLLTQQADYTFRVAALTTAGRSSFSDPTATETVSLICEPPANLYCDYVTDNMIKIRWTSPTSLDRDLKVTNYEVKYWPNFVDESSAENRISHEKFLRLENLERGTIYHVKVAVVCGVEGASPFSPAIQIETLEQAERIALIVREVSSLVDGSPDPSAASGLALYNVPLRFASDGSHGEIETQRKIFGYPGLKFQRKTILVVGASGAGKTTLINAMINHILGVEWKDDFRFQLIQEPKMTQAKSQTGVVTAYDLFHAKGSRVDYSLTIVDTPGFGDTKGLERDNEIREQIRQYFSHPGGIQQVEAVCFVVQASLPRLTPTQLYIFESILSIFGKDIRDNIRLMATFSDGQEPPVLAAIQEAKIPYPLDSNDRPLHHKFNNSSYFAGRINARMDSLNASFFSIGEDNFQRFFEDLHQMKTTSLTLTKEVLKERKQLEVVVEGLQQRLHAGLVKMEEFKQVQKVLNEHKDQMAANQDFQFEVEYVVAEQKDISGTGHYISNCQNCKWTCHYPCKHFRDADRVNCFAMDEKGNCKICPGRCSYNDHFNQKFKWEQVTKKVQRSSEAIRLNYKTAQNNSATCEEILQKMSDELKDFEKQLLDLVETTYPLIQRLDEIALRPHPFSAPDYIDLIIAAERQERRIGYLIRIENLQKLRQMAEILSKLINRENILEKTSPAASGSTNSAST